MLVGSSTFLEQVLEKFRSVKKTWDIFSWRTQDKKWLTSSKKHALVENGS